MPNSRSAGRSFGVFAADLDGDCFGLGLASGKRQARQFGALGYQCGYDVRLTLVYAILLMQGPSGLADQFQKGTRAGRRPVPYPVVGTLSLLLDFAVPGTLGVFWAPVSPLIGLAPSGIER